MEKAKNRRKVKEERTGADGWIGWLVGGCGLRRCVWLCVCMCCLVRVCPCRTSGFRKIGFGPTNHQGECRRLLEARPISPRACLQLFGWLLPNTANVMNLRKWEILILFQRLKQDPAYCYKTNVVSNAAGCWAPRALPLPSITPSHIKREDVVSPMWTIPPIHPL
ncbi:hypothetical protein BDB00DRAFT_295348 [Zychaea mexicana]|uniref:uncharacterized protein n=1 Tax=Zychaea mexicana TaxID=64656 RepID=UPI0022FDCA30|nr:uncharacterized protein BDB00DRAFT_295348 [Zychaea mexicana]KAI9494579.1 hypothetical protein BDB00DRAFT_295348 [Zychaea mexicana]